MIPYDDPRWKELYGGCHALYDPTDALRALESEGRPRKEVWDEFNQHLHHQGETDTAAYAVVPELVRIAREKSMTDWQPFGLVAFIEVCRRSGRNCSLPPWLEESYFAAIRDLARYGCSLGDRPWSRELTRSILSVVAYANDLPSYGRLLIDFTNDELQEMTDKYLGKE